jgi:DNA-binding Xre family transcriptional regulator
MIVLNLKSVFKARGIDNPASFLLNAGLSRHTVTNFLHNNSGSVKLRYIDLICTKLNCTPNDLFVWVPDKNNVLPESHLLNTIKRGNTVFDLKETMKSIPINQLNQIVDILKNNNSTSTD